MQVTPTKENCVCGTRDFITSKYIYQGNVKMKPANHPTSVQRKKKEVKLDIQQWQNNLMQ